MRNFKNIIHRIIPVLLVAVVTVVMSLIVYGQMMRVEREECWEKLDLAVRSMEDRIALLFSDHLNLLEYVAEGVVMKSNFGELEEVQNYLTSVQESMGTLFSRIDIVYPSGVRLTQNGERYTFQGTDSFAEMASRGTHISPRITDDDTGREVIYLGTPLVVDGNIVAMLMGMIDCGTMSEQFVSYSYDGRGRTLLIDRTDGNYLINGIQNTLGNMYDEDIPVQPPEYAHVYFREDIVNGKSGTVAYYALDGSGINYIAYMPVGNFNWSVAVMVTEDVIFEDLHKLRTMLSQIGVILFCLLAVYVWWTITVTNRVLQSEKQAQQAAIEQSRNHAKTVFLSSISHDIRTPLNGIVGMLEVIRLRGDIPAHMVDPLQKIDTSARYLIRLASDVLDVNELEAGKVVLGNEPVFLPALADAVRTIVEPRAAETGIGYHMDISAIEHTCVLGSEVHLSKILINLVGNAIKYNKENGQVWVRIEEEQGEETSGRYRFIVKDTGIGMTEAFQKHMFNAFEQENATVRGVYMGHGLGLSIVRQLVDKMNGTIDVESEKDVGTTITVTLPLVYRECVHCGRCETEENSAFLLRGNGQTDDEIDLTGVHILVAEDNELNMEIAQVMLTATGAQVTGVENGRKAMEAFRDSASFAFDIILMDIMMPEMDGHEATRQIRSLDRPDATLIPILAMTAGNFSEDIRRCKEDGMNEHIAKPLDMQTMLEKVQSHVAQYRNRTAF